MTAATIRSLALANTERHAERAASGPVELSARR